MDSCPLLSGNRESSRRAPQQLLSPLQVDTSLIVFEDGVVDENNNINGDGAGPVSDTRTSIFSSFSSFWSNRTAAGVHNGGGSNGEISRFTAALSRPFQRLRFWCCGGERCQYCWRSLWCFRCCRDSSSSAEAGLYEDENEDFDNPAHGGGVAADAPRACGKSHSSYRNKDSILATMPHRGRGATSDNVDAADGGAINQNKNNSSRASRQHRVYAPPHPRPSEAGFNGVGTSAAELRDADEANPGSAAESLVARSSTPPSSIAFDRVATAPGVQLVMQHGVLVRVAYDGTCTHVVNQSAFQEGTHDGNDQGYLIRPSILEGGRASSPDALSGHTGEASLPFNRGADMFEFRKSSAVAVDASSSNSYAVSMAMDALEASRQPLRSLEQLSSVLSHLAPYLPLRVETELDINSSSALLPSGTRTAQGAVSLTSHAALPAIPICVHVLGPVQSCPTAVALRLLEDVLLEDCDTSRLCVSALHCADLDLRGGVGVDVDEAISTLTGSSGRSNSRDGAEEGGKVELHSCSNASLDLPVSTVTQTVKTFKSAGLFGQSEHHCGGGAFANAATTTSPAALSVADAASHVLAFLHNFVKGRGSRLTTLHFTRCFVVPHDMSKLVPLPLRTVRRLRYEHCALTPAHVDALLTLARHQDVEGRSSVKGPVGSGPVVFGVLEELQLSGSLTSECIAELLDYIEEQQLWMTEGSNAAVALHQLILPASLVRRAKEHPFVQANYQRLSVVSAY